MNKEIDELREAAREVVSVFSPCGQSEKEWLAMERLEQAILAEALARFKLEGSLVVVNIDAVQGKGESETG